MQRFEETFTHVTDRQGKQFAQFCRENGISRDELRLILEQSLKSNEFVKNAKNGGKWFADLVTSARVQGITLRLFRKIEVDYSAKVQVQGFEDIRTLSNDYVPATNEKVVGTLVMARGRNFETTLKWAVSHELQKTIPVELLAFGKTFLQDNIGRESYLVETTGCDNPEDIGKSLGRSCVCRWFGGRKDEEQFDVIHQRRLYVDGAYTYLFGR